MKPDSKQVADLKSKIEAMTKESARFQHEATEGFNKLVATIGERDQQIRALTTQATILRSDLEAAAERFQNLENDRDVQKHLAESRGKRVEELEFEEDAISKVVASLQDDRATLMAALRRVLE